MISVELCSAIGHKFSPTNTSNGENYRFVPEIVRFVLSL